MKSIFIFLVFLLMMAGCKDNKSTGVNSTPFNSDEYKAQVEKMPEVVGGISALQKNLIYPSEAMANNIEGKVLVQVYLDEKGEVVNTKILKSDHKSLEQSAVDAIGRTKFTPGEANGESVKTQIVIPIVFKMNSDGGGSKDKYPEYQISPDVYPMPVGGIEALAKNIVYPENEKKKGIQGQVLVMALISADGTVEKSEIVKGINPALDNAALKAINRTKFTPAKKNGTAVKSQIQIPVTFKLQ